MDQLLDKITSLHFKHRGMYQIKEGYIGYKNHEVAIWEIWFGEKDETIWIDVFPHFVNGFWPSPRDPKGVYDWYYTTQPYQRHNFQTDHYSFEPIQQRLNELDYNALF